jgi:rod shape-determining protein MreD
MKAAAWLLGLAFLLEGIRLTVLGRLSASPDLLLGTVVLVGLYRTSPAGTLTGFGLGLLRDLVYGNPPGLEMIPLTMVGWAVDALGPVVYRESLLTQVVVLGGAGLLGGSLRYLLFEGGDPTGLWIYLLRIVLPGALLGALLLPLVAAGGIRVWKDRREILRHLRKQLQVYERKLYVKR